MSNNLILFNKGWVLSLNSFSLRGTIRMLSKMFLFAKIDKFSLRLEKASTSMKNLSPQICLIIRPLPGLYSVEPMKKWHKILAFHPISIKFWHRSKLGQFHDYSNFLSYWFTCALEIGSFITLTLIKNQPVLKELFCIGTEIERLNLAIDWFLSHCCIKTDWLAHI